MWEGSIMVLPYLVKVACVGSNPVLLVLLIIIIIVIVIVVMVMLYNSCKYV